MPLFQSNTTSARNSAFRRLLDTITNRLEKTKLGRFIIAKFSPSEELIEVATMRNISELPPHVLDIIMSNLKTKDIIKLGQVNSRFYNYIHTLAKHRKVRRKQIHISDNKFYRVSFDVTDKVYQFEEDIQLKWLQTRILYYWNSTIHQSLEKPEQFFMKIFHLSITDELVEEFLEFIPMIRKLNRLDIKGPSLNEENLIRLIDSINFTTQKSFRLTINPKTPLTPDAVERYLQKTKHLDSRAIGISTCIDNDLSYFLPVTLDGIIHFFESEIMKNDRPNSTTQHAGYIMIDPLDDETTENIAAELQYRYPDNIRILEGDEISRAVIPMRVLVNKRWFYIRKRTDDTAYVTVII